MVSCSSLRRLIVCSKISHQVQAPKSVSPAAKRALILEYFHTTASAFSIKELEATLPSVASIHSIQVKEYIQALADDGLVRVEKIGSSNWYWSFPSEARKFREKALGELEAEEKKLKTAIESLLRELEEETAKREESNEETDGMMLDGDGNETLDRNALTSLQASLQAANSHLEKQLEEYSGNDPAEVQRKEAEAMKWRLSAERWTENLESVESYLMKLTGDRPKIRMMMESLCAGEYVAGEGFVDM